MNDLITTTKELAKHFPHLDSNFQQAEKVLEMLSKVKNLRDVERYFLKGNGLSKNTYRTYLSAVKSFCHFTKFKPPTKYNLADVESYYDHILEKGGIGTAYLRIAGLKKFFAGIAKVIPWPYYRNVFEDLEKPENAKLKEKLSRTGKVKKQLAMSQEEVMNLLKWLKKDRTEYGQGNYAMVFMFLTSGLRSFEMAQLTWGKIERVDGIYYARFRGKGSTTEEDRQELYEPAVRAAKRYFMKTFDQTPGKDDHLFWTVPTYPGEDRRPMVKHQTLWVRINKIGFAAKEAGIIRDSIHFTPHLFRRTFASILEKMQMPVSAIQVKTRHKSLETLQNHYLSNEELAAPYFDKAFAVVDKQANNKTEGREKP